METECTAKVDGIRVAAGNTKLMKYLNVEYMNVKKRYERYSPGIDGRKYAGHIVISDRLRNRHAKEAVAN